MVPGGAFPAGCLPSGVPAARWRVKNMGAMELMSPAGSPLCGRAVLQAGADAVYLGLRDLSHQRDQCRNFDAGELDALCTQAGARGVGVYVTFNSSYNRSDYAEILRRIDELAEREVAGVILADIGLIRDVHRRHPTMEIELSVQGQCANRRSAALLAELGVSRVVLDRNISIAEARAIKEASGLAVDLFAFGFQCYSQDSICYMGDYWSGMPCKVHCTGRVRFDDAPGASARHLFMKYYSGLRYLDRMADAGVDRIKLEGRHRSSAYARRVTAVFRAALDHLARCRVEGRDYRVAPAWEAALRTAAMGFEVTDGFFVDGDYRRRVDTHPPLESAAHFVFDTVRVLVESGNLETFRTEMRAGWDRFWSRSDDRPDPDRGSSDGSFGGLE